MLRRLTERAWSVKQAEGELRAEGELQAEGAEGELQAEGAEGGAEGELQAEGAEGEGELQTEGAEGEGEGDRRAGRLLTSSVRSGESAHAPGARSAYSPARLARCTLSQMSDASFPKTKADLDRLVNDKAEEGQQLEFKSALLKTDKGKTELSKDVSAMANSAGGVIIYGVLEKDHFAAEITAIKRQEFSKEWLDQVISSNIQPKIEGLLIHPIPLGNDDDVAYVVVIPQSTTAHQAKDKRYYKRYNFEAVAMDDYEIRDVMNRIKNPVIDLEFEIVRRTEPEQVHPQGIIYGQSQVRVVRSYLYVWPRNVGRVFAQYLYYHVAAPAGLLVNGLVELRGDNTTRDFLGLENGINARYGSRWYQPVLPNLTGPSLACQLAAGYERILRDPTAELRWTSHADNAAQRTGVVKLSEIHISDEDDK